MLLDLIWQRDGLFLTFSLCTWRNTFPVQFCKTNACAFDLPLLLPSAVSEMISYELWQWAACSELFWNMLKWLVKKLLLCQKHRHAVQDSWYNSLAWCLQLGRKYSRKTSLANDKGQARPMSGLVMQISNVQLHGKNLHQLVNSIFHMHTTQAWQEFEDSLKPFLSIPETRHQTPVHQLF